MLISFMKLIGFIDVKCLDVASKFDAYAFKYTLSNRMSSNYTQYTRTKRICQHNGKNRFVICPHNTTSSNNKTETA